MPGKRRNQYARKAFQKWFVVPLQSFPFTATPCADRMTCSGCCTCRKRHQKCDETKPACWNCRLRGVECGGYGIKLTEFTAHSGRDGQMVSKMVSGPSSKNPSGLRQRQRERERERETTPRTANRKKTGPLRVDQTFRIEPGEASGSSPIQFVHVRPSEPASRSAPVTNHHASPEPTSAQQDPSHERDAATSPRASRPSTASTVAELMHILSPAEDNASDNADYTVGDGLDEVWAENSDPGQHDALPISQVLAASPWAQFDAYFALPPFEIDSNSEQFGVAPSSSAPATVEDDDEPGTDEQQTLRVLEDALVNLNEPALCPQPNDPYDQYLFCHCE